MVIGYISGDVECGGRSIVFLLGLERLLLYTFRKKRRLLGETFFYSYRFVELFVLLCFIGFSIVLF